MASLQTYDIKDGTFYQEQDRGDFSMNSLKGYVPLSLAILLAATVPAANAGSALDPYTHIKPNAPAAKKKGKDERAVVPQFDDAQAKPQTFTNKSIILPSSDFEEKKPEKKGLLGIPKVGMPKVGMPKMGGITGGLKAGAGAMVSGTKKVGGGIANASKDAAGAVGSGVKSTGDKLADAKDSAISKTKKQKKDSPNKLATKAGSVDELYTEASKDVLAANKNKAKAKASEGKKSLAFMPKFGKKKSKKEEPNDINLRPRSGFEAAATEPDEEVVAEIQEEKAKRIAAKKAKAAKEKFEPIVNLPEDNIQTNSNQVAATPAPTTTVNKPAKKSKFGMPSFKASMPSMPGLKKKKKSDAPKQSVAAAPKKQAPVPVKKEIEESQVAIDPNEFAEGDITAANQFNTGDKEIDNAVAKSPAPQAPTNKVAQKPAKKNKIGGMSSAMKGGFDKFNFLNKKKKQPDPQTATKADAPKQM